MALNFPDSPTDGQVFNNYYWDDTATVWRNLSDLNTYANFSNTPTGTYTDGFDYKYISFTANDTLTVTRSGFADILLVGGGGAGGHWGGGGGGAGGVLYIESIYLPDGSLDVVVGDGGVGYPSGQAQQNFPGANGKPSSLWQYYVPGGGGGGSPGYLWNTTTYYSAPAPVGASAGGKGVYSTGGQGSRSAGIPGIGNDGGLAFGGTAGGGGGAGAVGGDATAGVQGNGGAGRSISITGSSVFYGGGGAGPSPATGGVGGGGSNSAGTDGLGGGGAGASGTSLQHAGGSGIVIVRVRA